MTAKATPPVPRQVDPELRRFLEAIKEKTDIGEGDRGNPVDRFIRVSDLLDMGIVRRLSNAGRLVGGGNLVPTAPLPDMSVPPKPAGFTVTDGFSYIYLTWDEPQYANHGYTEIWRASEDNLANATLISQQIGMIFADPDVVYGQSYYYWIRFHSQNMFGAGRAGPYNDTVGTPGKVAEDPGQLLDLLSGQITSDQLHHDLAEPIAQIPSIMDGLSAVEGRVLLSEQEITDLHGSVADINGDVLANYDAITALSGRVTDTEQGLVVEANLRDELRTEILGSGGALATAINDLATTVSNTYATATSVNQLSVEFNNRAGAIENRMSVDGDVGKVTAQWTVKAQVGDLIGGVGLRNDGDKARFYVQADTFAVYSPGVTKTVPFIIDGGKVIMDTALIKDGTITNAKIGTMSVDKLTGNTAAFVSANITNGSITNAKIGSFIQSNNYAAGSSGWAINKSGSAEFQNILARGDIQASSLKANTVMVDTLHIQDHAVTVTEVLTHPGEIEVLLTETTLAQKGIVFTNISGGSVITVVIDVEFYSALSGDAEISDMYLKRNGTLIKTWYRINELGTFTSYVTRTFIDAPGSGTHTYTVTAKKRESGIMVKAREIALMLSGAKR